MFSANSGTGSNAYRSVGIGSIVDAATPHQLVALLFDGARAAIAQAKGHLDRHETAAKGAAISKAIAIIDDGLKLSLDMKVGGDLAINLRDLYTYMSHRLLYANVKNDGAALDEVEKLLHQLGDAWASIATKVAKTPAAKTAPAAGPVQASRIGAAPTQEKRAAVATTQTYDPGATGRQQAGGIAAAKPSAPAGNTTPSSLATSSGSAPAASPSSQQSRLAAAYGVR